ncbi:AMP-binding protein [Azotobacter beijerinckii]|uniref:AMP-binding protein n=1 Tax=Azotobacter beijerinckii TaxID=170623 RepID=UPI001B8AD27F|nr:AMP-binding protein [Azotobacter beijerinckii]
MRVRRGPFLNGPQSWSGHAPCTPTQAWLRAARLAGFLRRNLRLEAGDRVAIYMSNCPEYLECLYGMLWAGLVAVPINAKLHPREASYILADAG